MTFDGTTFLVTGGSLGIGRQMTIDLIARGAQVLVCGRHASHLEALEREVPGVKTQVCDVRDYPSVLALRDRAQELFGAPDVLINNAAIFQRFDVQDEALPVDHWISEIDINVMGTMRVTHALLPLLRRSSGATIVNLTSPAAYLPMTAAPAYSASKAAIYSWTVSLRHQLRDTNISVVELNPPVVDTRMNANNPNVEGMKRWSTEKFSAHVLERLGRSRRRDILVGDARLVKSMSRIVPGMVFNIMNPKRLERERKTEAPPP